MSIFKSREQRIRDRNGEKMFESIGRHSAFFGDAKRIGLLEKLVSREIRKYPDDDLVRKVGTVAQLGYRNLVNTIDVNTIDELSLRREQKRIDERIQQNDPAITQTEDVLAHVIPINRAPSVAGQSSDGQTAS